MTSKESLEYIRNIVIEEDPDYDCQYCIDDYDCYKRECDIIEKDLEVLEILKKYLYYDNKNHCIKMKYIYKRTTSFDYEELKEWIENDN